jgi:hypothetical protein
MRNTKQKQDRIVAAGKFLTGRINNPKPDPEQLKAEALAKELQIIYDQVNKGSKRPST